MKGKPSTRLTADDTPAMTHTALILAPGIGTEEDEGTHSIRDSTAMGVAGLAFQLYDTERDYQKGVDLILTALSRQGRRKLWVVAACWRWRY